VICGNKPRLTSSPSRNNIIRTGPHPHRHLNLPRPQSPRQHQLRSLRPSRPRSPRPSRPRSPRLSRPQSPRPNRLRSPRLSRPRSPRPSRLRSPLPSQRRPKRMATPFTTGRSNPLERAPHGKRPPNCDTRGDLGKSPRISLPKNAFGRTNITSRARSSGRPLSPLPACAPGRNAASVTAMKFLFPLCIAVLLPACASTPQDSSAAHQRKLWEEARANYLAMGGRDSSQPEPNQPTAAQPAPTPKHRLFASRQSPPPPAPKPAPQPKLARNNDDTVYYWQVPPPAKSTSPRDQVAEAKYARQLAKRPEDLTPEERIYAHEHY